jgi:D-alanyl-D-alanine dipeptidase
MVAEGFIPLPNEWWHFDWRDWRLYPIMDVPLEAI